MITIEKEIEKYISDVSSKLLCSKEKKKELIEDIRGAVFDFAEGSDTKDIADIYKHFGTPEELAKAHMSELDPAQIKKKVNIRRVVIVAVVIMLIVFAVTMIIVIIDSNRDNIDKVVVDSVKELVITNVYLESEKI